MIAQSPFCCSIVLASLAIGAGEQAQARNPDFGRYAIGSAPDIPQRYIVKRSGCQERGDTFSCNLLLRDGIWYRLDKNRIIEKTIRLPSQSMPSWLNGMRDVPAAKTALERVSGNRVRVWHDDYRTTYAECRDWLKSAEGIDYNVVIRFRNAKMLDITVTTLPHEDV